MKLIINTSNPSEIRLSLIEGRKQLAEILLPAERRQAEELLPAIDRILREQKVLLTDISKIVVASQGQSYTALRIGILTANALAFGLNIPVEPLEVGGKTRGRGKNAIVLPTYDRPLILQKKKPLIIG